MLRYASIAWSSVLDLVGVDLRDRAVELDLGRALERRRDVALVGVDEIEPLTQPAVAALERDVAPSSCVGSISSTCSRRVRRDVGLEELLLVDGRELHQDVDALALAS